jgi:hypothetical protein
MRYVFVGHSARIFPCCSNPLLLLTLIQVKRNDNASDDGYNPSADPSYNDRTDDSGVSGVLYKSLVNVFKAKRMVASARHAYPLQRVGLRAITKIKPVGTVLPYFGVDHHYNVKVRWSQEQLMYASSLSSPDAFSMSGRSSRNQIGVTGVDDDHQLVLDDRDEGIEFGEQVSPPKHSIWEILGAHVRNNSTLDSARNGLVNNHQAISEVLNSYDEKHFDLSIGRFKKVPKLNSGNPLAKTQQYVSGKYFPTEMFSDGQIIKACLRIGYAPICQFDKKDGGIANVMFGPLTNHTEHTPIELGTIFPAVNFYSHLGLKYTDINSDVWSTNAHRINAIVCCRPEKNFLFFPGTDLEMDQAIDPLNPLFMDTLADYDRIKSGQQRSGIYVYGSGGCSTLLGSVAPSADPVVGGESAHFEYSNIAKKKYCVDHCGQEQSSCNGGACRNILPYHSLLTGSKKPVGRQC